MGAIARKFKIDHKTILCWLKNKEKISEAQDDWHSKVKQIHPGRASLLKPVEALILQFIFELREEGMAVTIALIVKHAKEILPAFQTTSPKAQELIV